jgi:hypothetical protein
MSQLISDPSNIRPRNFRTELFGFATELGCGFADARQAAFNGIHRFDIAQKLPLRHAGDVTLDPIDVLDDIVKSQAGSPRRQQPVPATPQP